MLEDFTNEIMESTNAEYPYTTYYYPLNDLNPLYLKQILQGNNQGYNNQYFPQPQKDGYLKNLVKSLLGLY